MKFITTDIQAKEAMSAIVANFQLQNINSFGEQVEYELMQVIGWASENEIKAHPEVLSMLRKAIMDLTIASFVSSGAVIISDTGISVATGTSRAPASDKKLMALKRDAIERGWKHFEQTIVLMERHIANFAIWSASEERKAYFATLFSNSTELGPFGGVGVSASLFHHLRGPMVRLQDDMLEPVLGRELLDELIASRGVFADAKKKHLYRLCLRVLAPKAVAEAMMQRMVSIGEDGLYQSAISSNTDNVEQKDVASARAIHSRLSQLVNEADAMLVKVNKYLKANASDFPTAKAAVYGMQDFNQPDSNVYLM